MVICKEFWSFHFTHLQISTTSENDLNARSVNIENDLAIFILHSLEKDIHPCFINLCSTHTFISSFGLANSEKGTIHDNPDLPSNRKIKKQRNGFQYYTKHSTLFESSSGP